MSVGVAAGKRLWYGRPVPDVDTLVLASVNASLRRTIDADTLATCLARARIDDGWGEHLHAFFEDVPREAMFRFMIARALSAARVLVTYRALHGAEPPDAELTAWLTGLADAA